MILDVDYFKLYNDTYGHQEGDDCLKKITTTISETTKRSGDMVFRYGGEEFSVILTETDHEGAKKVAENIRQAILDLKIEHSSSPSSEYITLSVGVNTVIPEKNLALAKMIEGADKALYDAKNKGRNRVSSYFEILKCPFTNEKLP